MWFLFFINQLISIGYGVNRGAAFGTIYIFLLKNKRLSKLFYLFCLSNLH